MEVSNPINTGSGSGTVSTTSKRNRVTTMSPDEGNQQRDDRQGSHHDRNRGDDHGEQQHHVHLDGDHGDDGEHACDGEGAKAGPGVITIAEGRLSLIEGHLDEGGSLG